MKLFTALPGRPNRHKFQPTHVNFWPEVFCRHNDLLVCFTGLQIIWHYHQRRVAGKGWGLGRKFSGNISKSLEVITFIIFRLNSPTLLGAVVKTSYFFWTQCIKLEHKDLESCLSRMCLFYSITLQCWTWKQLIDTCDKQIAGNIRNDWNKFLESFRGKFPEISELTTPTVASFQRITSINCASPLMSVCLSVCLRA